jgi:hypothetical protein
VCRGKGTGSSPEKKENLLSVGKGFIFYASQQPKPLLQMERQVHLKPAGSICALTVKGLKFFLSWSQHVPWPSVVLFAVPGEPSWGWSSVWVVSPWGAGVSLHSAFHKGLWGYSPALSPAPSTSLCVCHQAVMVQCGRREAEGRREDACMLESRRRALLLEPHRKKAPE